MFLAGYHMNYRLHAPQLVPALGGSCIPDSQTAAVYKHRPHSIPSAWDYRETGILARYTKPTHSSVPGFSGTVT